MQLTREGVWALSLFTGQHRASVAVKRFSRAAKVDVIKSNLESKEVKVFGSGLQCSVACLPEAALGCCAFTGV